MDTYATGYMCVDTSIHVSPSLPASMQKCGMSFFLTSLHVNPPRFTSIK